VAALLKERGFHRIRPLAGGLDGWASAGFRIETRDIVLEMAQ
jgi:rhodanese-related sulfurtransferase